MANNKTESNKNFRHIVRIANADLKGEMPLYIALTKVKGIGPMYSNLVCHFSGLDRFEKVGNIPEKDLDKVRDVIDNPEKYDIPDWMKNRRHDYETGADMHLIDTDLRFNKDNDIKRLKKIKAYRGYRHAFGLPSRGQRTKSNFRRNKGKAVGVRKRKGAKAGRV